MLVIVMVLLLESGSMTIFNIVNTLLMHIQLELHWNITKINSFIFSEETNESYHKKIFASTFVYLPLIHKDNLVIDEFACIVIDYFAILNI